MFIHGFISQIGLILLFLSNLYLHKQPSNNSFLFLFDLEGFFPFWKDRDAAYFYAKEPGKLLNNSYFFILSVEIKLPSSLLCCESSLSSVLISSEKIVKQNKNQLPSQWNILQLGRNLGVGNIPPYDWSVAKKCFNVIGLKWLNIRKCRKARQLQK